MKNNDVPEQASQNDIHDSDNDECKGQLVHIDTTTATYRNGGAYRGKWKNDRKHGEGAVLFTNCTRYDGKWKDGTRRGQAGAFSAITPQDLNNVADDLQYCDADGVRVSEEQHKPVFIE